MSGRTTATTVILPADQQYKMPQDYQTWAVTGQTFSLRSHVMNREAFMMLLDMHVPELPDCSWFNWTDVMFYGSRRTGSDHLQSATHKSVQERDGPDASDP